MKIVFLSPSAQGGGAEEVLYDLAAGLKEAEKDWSLLVICGEEGPLVGRLRGADIDTEVLPFAAAFRAYGEQASTPADQEGRFVRSTRLLRAGAHFAGYVLRLRSRLRKWRPDIVHSNGMKMHLAGAFAAHDRRTALVWHLHDYLGARRITSRLLPRLRSRVRLALANSASVAADARIVLPGTRVEVLENSVDPARFQPDGPRLDLDRLCGLPALPAGMLRVGLMATFARWKGQDIFLRAIGLLPRDLPARFYLIGGPVYATPGSQWTHEELAHAAAPFGDRVGLTGWVGDSPSALRALDVVVHASVKPEPFGLVIIQALACGRAVIVSAEGGAGEAAAGLPGAVPFTPRDPESLARAMLFLITSPDARSAALKNGPAAVRERFTRSRMAAQAAAYLRTLAPDAA